MNILFATGPGSGLTLPVVPLIWAARAAGHDVLLATTAAMTDVGARSGLPVVDVHPDRDVWNDMIRGVAAGRADSDQGSSAQLNGTEVSDTYRRAASAGSPFGLFTLTMTAGTIAAGHDLGADLVVYTSDHAAGILAALKLDVPSLEVGNRISWSMRDREFRAGHTKFFDDEDEIIQQLRADLDIPTGRPRLLARIDPRAPSMGGITEDEPDFADGVPWWPMRYVPYNGGTVVPEWARSEPDRPRVGVTLGTVVPMMTGTSTLSVIIEALGSMDVDVVLAAGAADLSTLAALPDNVRSVGYLPLSAFLTTCSLLVHHGGSGTTAAPLHFGVPQLVLPSFADNPMAAQRVVDRGVGLSHDPTTIDADTAGALIKRVLEEPTFAAAAREVRAELVSQPSPAAIVDRLSAAMDTAEVST